MNPFHPNAVRHNIRATTPDGPRGHSMLYAALCIVASVAVSVISVIAIIGWLS